MKRRTFISAATFLPAAGALQAQAPFPSQAIKIIIPVGAGGTYDIVARTIASDMSQQYKVPVIVENKPGGNYLIAMRALATAKPDGYTIGVAGGSILVQWPILFPEVQFKLEDFQEVAPLVSMRTVLVTSAASPIKDLAAFVRHAKTSPQAALLGTTGLGTASHLTILQLGRAAGIPVQAVPYASNPAALTALLGGHIPALSTLLGGAFEQYRAGKVRILAYSGSQRHPSIPDIPTFAEAGYPQLTSESWAAMYAPQGTPAPIVNTLHQAITASLKKPGFQQKLPIDTAPFPATPTELRQMALDDRSRLGKFLSDPEIRAKVRPN